MFWLQQKNSLQKKSILLVWKDGFGHQQFPYFFWRDQYHDIMWWTDFEEFVKY